MYLNVGPVQASFILPWHHPDPEPSQSCPALTQVPHASLRFRLLCFFADQVGGDAVSWLCRLHLLHLLPSLACSMARPMWWLCWPSLITTMVLTTCGALLCLVPAVPWCLVRREAWAGDPSSQLVLNMLLGRASCQKEVDHWRNPKSCKDWDG